MSARQIAALLGSNNGHHQGEDDQLTTNQQLVPSLLLPSGHYPPQTSTSPFLQIQNNTVDSFHPRVQSFERYQLNSMRTHQLAHTLGFDTHYQPHITCTQQNLQQHDVAAPTTRKRKFVPDGAVSKGFDTCIQHPKQAKWNQDPIAASAFDFIGPSANVDDINMTSNPMVFPDVGDKEQSQAFSRTKHPEKSMRSSTFFKKLDPTEAINVPCPPLCGAVFSRTGELVTFNNGPVKQLWSFYQIHDSLLGDTKSSVHEKESYSSSGRSSHDSNSLSSNSDNEEEGGEEESCSSGRSSHNSNSESSGFDHEEEEEDEENWWESLQNYKWQKEVAAAKLAAAEEEFLRKRTHPSRYLFAPKTIADLANMKQCLQNLKLEYTPAINDSSNSSSGAKDVTSSTPGSNNKGGENTCCSGSSSSNNNIDSNKTKSGSSSSDSSSDESIIDYKNDCKFIIASKKFKQSWFTVTDKPDEAILLKYLKEDIANFKKEYGSWKLLKGKERMKQVITIPWWTGACEYRYTREYEESKQNIIHHTRFVVEETEKILANYNDKKPMTVNAIKRKAKRDSWDKFAEFAKEQRKKWRRYKKKRFLANAQQQCDMFSNLLQTPVVLDLSKSADDANSDMYSIQYWSWEEEENKREEKEIALIADKKKAKNIIQEVVGSLPPFPSPSVKIIKQADNTCLSYQSISQLEENKKKSIQWTEKTRMQLHQPVSLLSSTITLPGESYSTQVAKLQEKYLIENPRLDDEFKWQQSKVDIESITTIVKTQVQINVHKKKKTKLIFGDLIANTNCCKPIIDHIKKLKYVCIRQDLLYHHHLKNEDRRWIKALLELEEEVKNGSFCFPKRDDLQFLPPANYEEPDSDHLLLLKLYNEGTNLVMIYVPVFGGMVGSQLVEVLLLRSLLVRHVRRYHKMLDIKFTEYEKFLGSDRYIQMHQLKEECIKHGLLKYAKPEDTIKRDKYTWVYSTAPMNKYAGANKSEWNKIMSV